MYLDSENWLKASVEYENDSFQHLGSVVTNDGYSDWATTAIPADVKTMWYRFSRRADDFCIECSRDGVEFSQMRVCHMRAAADEIRFGMRMEGARRTAAGLRFRFFLSAPVTCCFGWLGFSRDLASQGSSLCSSGNLIAPRQAHSRFTASRFSTTINWLHS